MTPKWLLAAVLALLPAFGAAQGVDDSGPPEPAPGQITPDDPQPAADSPPPDPEAALITDELAEWDRFAKRAEATARRGDASTFATSRLRAELVVWRDRFLDQTGQNSGRIATVEGQIAALGAVPEGGEEPDAIAARRAALQVQLGELTAPQVLADEAFARANGLIGELDAQVLQRQTSELTARGPSPLIPSNVIAATGAIWEAISVLGVETIAGIRQQYAAGRLVANLPRVAVLLILALVLVVYARRWVTEWRHRVSQWPGRWTPLWLFGLSLGQIILPVLGLYAMAAGLDTLNVFGLRGEQVVAELPTAGLIIVFAWWLSRHVFPAGDAFGYLGYDHATRKFGRRYSVAISWVLGIGVLIDAALTSGEAEEGARAAIEWPVLAVLGVLLWRLGRAIATPPPERDGTPTSAGRMRRIVGRACIVAAVLGPIVAALGYAPAGRAIIVRMILSLGLIGFVVILQRMLSDLSHTDDTEDSKGSLIPVVISFVIYLASLPVFALLWGARVDDLLELWARFREGFAIGESRISPTDFLTFALVFGLGYLLTRFIQGSLRRSVLPRTRLDLGGQNAIVAGFGYLGIILAAIVAITSAGIDLSNLAIVAGALSVGIGFGLQNIVSNFVSGIILLIERPVSEGDWIEVGGQMGYVRAISVRSTRIETFDRTDVIVPNADLVSNQVTNWTRGNLVGRVIVPVGVAYGTDVDKVTQILKEIAEAHPLVVMQPPPAVMFMGFGADSLDFEIRAILRDVNYVVVAKSEMNYDISRRFAEAGIEIPFAQRDIWLRNPEALDPGNANTSKAKANTGPVAPLNTDMDAPE